MHCQSSAKCVLCCMLCALLNGPGWYAGRLKAVFAVNNAIVLLMTDMSVCLDLHAALCCPLSWIYVPCCAVLCCAAHAVGSA